MICANLFSRFSYEMGKSQYYYPPSAPEVSENRLFGMFHASTPKDVIMQGCHGTVKVVFANVAMGMGIDLHGVHTIIRGSNCLGISGTLPEFQSKYLSRTETLISLLLSRKLVWLMNSLVVNIVICYGTRQSSWQS